MRDLPYRSGVGVMLINADGRVFVGQRLDSSSEAWQMPQGGVDKGENPDDAAFRELWEETGVTAAHATLVTRSQSTYDYDLPSELQGRIWGGKYRGQRQYWYLMRFTGSDADVNIANDHPEFRAWQWVAPEQLVDLIVPFKRELYTAVIAEFQPHL